MILDIFVNLIHVFGTLNSIITWSFIEKNAMQYIVGTGVLHDPPCVRIHILEDVGFIPSSIDCSNVSNGRDILSTNQFGKFPLKIQIG